MLGGGPYYLSICSNCGEYDCWNGKCATCGYIEPEDEEKED